MFLMRFFSIQAYMKERKTYFHLRFVYVFNRSMVLLSFLNDNNNNNGEKFIRKNLEKPKKYSKCWKMYSENDEAKKEKEAADGEKHL